MVELETFWSSLGTLSLTRSSSLRNSSIRRKDRTIRPGVSLYTRVDGSLLNQSTMAEWVDFFIGAGLPGKVAENYASTFEEHRIQTNMLMDLDKEYLREMGVQAMGDVISILRHAKKTLGSKIPSGEIKILN